jgi:hypothetical protein
MSVSALEQFACETYSADFPYAQVPPELFDVHHPTIVLNDHDLIYSLLRVADIFTNGC